MQLKSPIKGTTGDDEVALLLATAGEVRALTGSSGRIPADTDIDLGEILALKSVPRRQLRNAAEFLREAAQRLQNLAGGAQPDPQG